MSDDALPMFTAEMKRYNARRRFRAGIVAAKTISALSGHSTKKTGSCHLDMVVQEAEEVLSATPTTEET